MEKDQIPMPDVVIVSPKEMVINALHWISDQMHHEPLPVSEHFDAAQPEH